MRVLVTGAKGMLGTGLTGVFGTRHEVIATDVEELDVSRWRRARQQVVDLRPDLVVHLAALTDVDRCEQEPSLAFLVNTVGTECVALACRQLGIPIVYVSTVAVFDGNQSSPYTEFDAPNPQSYYARSKWQGEEAVIRLVPDHFILRAGWLFGGRESDKKFVGKILALARSRDFIQVVDDKFGSPTYTLDFAEAALALLETGMYGTYHLVNTGRVCSRLEYARAVLQYAGIRCRLVPVSSSRFPLPAPRPRMEGAVNLRLQLLGLDLMKPWRDALKRYITSLEGN